MRLSQTIYLLLSMLINLYQWRTKWYNPLLLPGVVAVWNYCGLQYINIKKSLVFCIQLFLAKPVWSLEVARKRDDKV